MMPRKKRRTILIISILLVIIAIVSAIVVIYLTTDMFKSSDILFAKYIGQNMENLENVYHEIEKDDYRELMKQNKHTIENKVKVNYMYYSHNIICQLQTIIELSLLAK